MQKRIYFIRHGQTEANVTETTQEPTSSLSKEGIKQTDILAQRTLKLNFDFIISSDYERAEITAQNIHKKTNKPLEFSELFREYRRPSEFFGRPIGELGGDKITSKGLAQIEESFNNKGWHYSDEENFFDLKERALKALQYLEEHKGTNLLVVTHGNFLRTLLGAILYGENYSPNNYKNIDSTFELSNTSISVAEYKTHWRHPNGTWQINTWNDQAHLGELT